MKATFLIWVIVLGHLYFHVCFLPTTSAPSEMIENAGSGDADGSSNGSSSGADTSKANGSVSQEEGSSTTSKAPAFSSSAMVALLITLLTNVSIALLYLKFGSLLNGMATLAILFV